MDKQTEQRVEQKDEWAVRRYLLFPQKPVRRTSGQVAEKITRK